MQEHSALQQLNTDIGTWVDIIDSVTPIDGVNIAYAMYNKYTKEVRIFFYSDSGVAIPNVTVICTIADKYRANTALLLNQYNVAGTGTAKAKENNYFPIDIGISNNGFVPLYPTSISAYELRANITYIAI